LSDSKLDDLNKAYDDLLKDLRAQNESQNERLSELPPVDFSLPPKEKKSAEFPKELPPNILASAPREPDFSNLDKKAPNSEKQIYDDLDKYLESQKTSIELQKKKKGFFSWLFGKNKKDQNTDLNILSSELNQDKTDTDKLPLALEKDFLDAEQGFIEEPKQADFISTAPSANVPKKETKYKQDNDDLNAAISKIKDNPSKSSVNETGMRKEPSENIQEYLARLKHTEEEISKMESQVDAKINLAREGDTALSSKIDALSKDGTVLKNTMSTLLSKQEELEKMDLKAEVSKLKEDLSAFKAKSEDAQNSIVKISSTLSTFVNQTQLEKLKEMITQIDVYVDTFDDRERELEKKYQTIKDLIARLELLEVQIQKQHNDYEGIANDLQNKVNFVYKYLQQVQNSIYVLSKSVDLSKAETEQKEKV